MRKPCPRCGAKDPEDGMFIQATVYDGGSTFHFQKVCLSCFESMLTRAKGT